MADLNSVDLSLVDKAINKSSELVGESGVGGLWLEYENFQSKYDEVITACATRLQAADQTSLQNVPNRLSQWATTDAEARIIYDILIPLGNGIVSGYDSQEIIDYLDSLEIERPESTIEAGELLGLPRTSGYADDPVCTANGNFVHQETDLEVVGFAQVIEPQRTYNALAAETPGVFGFGWSSMLDMCLDDTNAEVIRVRLADGAVIPFWFDAETETFTPNTGRGLRVEATENDEARWRLSSTENQTWLFNANGVLVGGSNGHASFTVRRTGDRATFAEQCSRRWVEYRFNDRELVHKISTSDGRSATLAYDDAGYCVSVERPSGAMAYQTQHGRVVSVVDADGVRLVHNTYDDQGRVSSQTNEHGRTSTYEYLDGGMTRLTYGEEGPTNLYAHNPQGNLTAVFGSDGAAQRMWWDDQGRLIRIVERGGAETTYEFATDHPLSEQDLLTRRVDPDGLAEVCDYDDAGRVTTEIGRDEVVQRYVYSGAQTVPTRIVDADGSETIATYDQRDLPLTINDPDGVTTKMMWDNDGQLVSVTSAAGARSSLVYDRAGRLTRIIDPVGRERSFRYDDGGRLISVTEPDGLVTNYSHTAAGRPLTCSTEGPGSWTAAYNEAGLAATFTDAAGATSTFDYDDFGQLISQTDPTGAIFGQEFDSLGRLLKLTNPLAATTSYGYGPSGHLSSVEDADGHRWLREVDALGRTASVNGPGGRTSHWSYHPNGEIASTTDPAGRTTTYAVDDQGRLTTETGPDGNAIVYEYSPGGRLTSVTTAAQRQYRFVNDATGRMVEFIDPDGKTVAATYRPDGQISEFVAEGATTSIRYDEVGRVTGWSASDVADGPEAVFSPNSSEVTKAGANPARFDFDSRGLLSSVTDPTGVVTEFVSDLRGLVTQMNTGPTSSTFSYDPAGNLETATDPLGVETRFRHTPAGRLEAVSIGDQLGFDYTYNDAGNVAAIRSTDDTELVTYRYDDAGAVAEAATPTGSVGIGRDTTGRIVQTTDLDGHATSYARDNDGMVTKRTDSDGRSVSYLRSPSGNVTGFADSQIGEVAAPAKPQGQTRDIGGRLLTDGNGRTYRYDTAGRLEEATDEAERRWAFTYNDYGLLATDETPNFGRREFSYNAAGAVEQVTNVDGSTTEFVYDVAGRRTGEHRSDGSSVEFVWNDLDQLIRIVRTDPQGNTATTEVRFSGLGRVEQIDGLNIDWDDGLYNKPVTIGNQRFLRSGTAVRACVPSADWETGIGDDPFGLDYTDADVDLGYRGELTIDGLVFMGDRVYDPTTRAFLSRDPLPQIPGEAAFVSPYVYAFNDPVNYLDPSGRSPLMEEEFQTIKTDMEKTTWNKYGSTIVHTTLDVAGMVPVIGEAADALNAGIYLLEGDYANAALSLAAMVPIAGGAAVAGKYAVKGAKAANKARKARKAAKAFDAVPAGSADNVISASRRGRSAGVQGLEGLTQQQRGLVNKVPNFGDSVITRGQKVDISDLGDFTAATGDEFALLTRRSKAMLVRGSSEAVPIDVDQARKLGNEGWEFTAHSHPGTLEAVLSSSPGDRNVLRAFGGSESIIVNSAGDTKRFTPEGDSMSDWLP